MTITCCGLELLPHTTGTPKIGDSCADYGCPKCGKQVEITFWSKESYERWVNLINSKRTALGFKPESIIVSEVK